MVAAGGGAAVLPAALDTSVLLPGLLLVAALLLGAVLIALVGRWRKRAEPEPLDASAQLAQFRSLYEQGTLSQEEFDRLRTLLGGQLRQALDVPPRPALPAKPSPGPAGTPEPPADPQGGPPAPGPPEGGIPTN
jgi:hypothetical protein